MSFVNKVRSRRSTTLLRLVFKSQISPSPTTTWIQYLCIILMFKKKDYLNWIIVQCTRTLSFSVLCCTVLQNPQKREIFREVPLFSSKAKINVFECFTALWSEEKISKMLILNPLRQWCRTQVQPLIHTLFIALFFLTHCIKVT